jgi:dCMP deaminase
MSDQYTRPDPHEYYMGIAMAVRRRANCKGNRVGALAVVGNRIVSTGYNGTPQHMVNCLDGGCDRCNHRERYQSGTGYDLCICVHAEQNVILSAARHGIALHDGTIYSTMQPCFGCTKEMLQVGIQAVYYLHPWNYPDPNVQAEYEKLRARFPGGMKQLTMDDPDAAWAVSSLRARTVSESSDDTGHAST